MDFSSEIKKRIISVLKSSSEDLWIAKIAKKANINPMTASKFIHILEAEGKLTIKRLGDMKIVRLKK
jgi:predicted transcriptional regulator